MSGNSDIAEWNAARWAALRVLLHGVLIPALERWPDVKEGLSLWRRSLYVRPPRALSDGEDEPLTQSHGVGRRPAGRIVQARLDMWPLVDPQARADMARLASLYEGQELPVSAFVAAARQGGWDLTSRRAVPLLRELVEGRYLLPGRRRMYVHNPVGPGAAALAVPHVELARILNDLGSTLRQRFEQVLGAKLWVVGREVRAEALRSVAEGMFGGISNELEAASTVPSDVTAEDAHDFSFLRCGLLAVPEVEVGADRRVPERAVQLVVATAGAEFGREIGDFGRADEVLQKELIEALVADARENGEPLQEALRDRFGLSTWRTYDRWRKQRSIEQIEASEADRASAWLDGWVLQELSAMWPQGMPLSRLRVRLNERAQGRFTLEPGLIDVALGGMVQRDLVRLLASDRSTLVVAQPHHLVPAQALASMERDMITSLRPLPASLGDFERRPERYAVRTGVWLVERTQLPALTERIREQIAAAMDALDRSDNLHEKQPERAVVPARIFVSLRPGPLLL